MIVNLSTNSRVRYNRSNIVLKRHVESNTTHLYLEVRDGIGTFMKTSTFATSAVALLAAGALVFSASTAANAAYPPNASFGVSGSSTAAAGKTVNFTVKGSVKGDYSGESVSATIGGRTVTRSLSSSGTATLPVQFPSTAGEYSIKFDPSFGSSFSKAITVGKAAPISGLKAQNITSSSDKTSKISGSTPSGAVVAIKIDGPSGVATVYKSVTASGGKFSYTFSKASKKGTYEVSAYIKDNAKFYGTMDKSTSFKKTK